MKRKLLGFLLLLVMALSVLRPVVRADDPLSEEERKKQEAESQAARVSGLRDDLLLELSEKRAASDVLMDEMISLNNQITAARENIDRITQEMASQETDLDEQRAAMALRIQYAYEQPPASYLEILFGSRSLSEILNNAEYIRSISEYDAQMKEEFEKALDASEQSLMQMREEESRLTTLLADTAARFEQYQQMTEDLLKKINEYTKEAEEYSAEAAAHDREIAEITERLKREEEAAKKAAELARAQQEAEEKARREEESRAAEEESRRREAESRAAETTAAPEVPETLPVITEAPETAPPETAPPSTEATQPPESETVPPTQPPESETVPPETEPPETTPAETDPSETDPPETDPPETTPPETTEEMSELQRRYLIKSDERGVGSLEIDPNWLNPSGYTNLYFLAAIIDAEAGGQPYEGRLGVGDVIFNRILDPRFQMTIYDVVYAQNQFTPTINGLLDLVLARGARESCMQAAQDCFNGIHHFDTRWLYFCAPSTWEACHPPYTEYIQLGDHIFYY